MGEVCSANCNMSNHNYLRHKHTNTITTTSKKAVWERIFEKFSAACDHPRVLTDVTKKWENLVAKHRNVYGDYQRSLVGTGGGPFSGSISPLTEAVMDVVGKNVLNVMGFDLNLDSSFLHVESFASSSSPPLLSTDTETVTQHQPEQQQQSSSDIPLSCLQQQPTQASTSMQKQQPEKRCNDCLQSKRDLYVLKKRKLELQIQILENQLNER